MKIKQLTASVTAFALVFALAGFSAQSKAQALTTEIDVEIITKGPSGVGGDAVSQRPSMSVDGTKIVFESLAPDLIDGVTTTNTYNIFLYDVSTDTITLVTAGSSGVGGNGESWSPWISADGTKIVFGSCATDLVAGMSTTSHYNTFLYDVATATTTLVSTGYSGNGAYGTTTWVSVSGDGTKIVYASYDAYLVAGMVTNGDHNIFLYDTVSATTSLITTGSSGIGGDDSSDRPSISADGTKIVFQSWATDLIPGITANGQPNIFLYDVTTATTTLVTAGPSGIGGNGYSNDSRTTADGSKVVFESQSTDLIAGMTTPSWSNIFLYDVASATTTLVSKGPLGTGGDWISWTVSITPDGTKVAFCSGATDLIAGMTTYYRDNIFLYDVTRDTTTLVTKGLYGIGDNGYSSYPNMSNDGTKIVFVSSATDLIPGVTTTIRGNIFLATLTFYADVTFDPANGDAETIERVLEGAAVDKPADPVREGFAFKGWFTSAGAKWDFGDPVDDDMTLTARWAQLFTVTFDPANGDPIFTEKVPDGEAVNEPAEPAKADFIFDGWFTLGEVMWDFDDPIVEDMTLTAHWVADEEPVVPEEPDEPEEPEGPEGPEGPGGPEGPEEPGIPQTGDMLLLMSIAFMALAGGAMGTVALLRRKRTVL